jgi:2'-5' RNA ligase
MTPLPGQLINRWENGRDAVDPEHGVVYWHVLLGDVPQLRAAVQIARDRLKNFTGLHMTPLKWLHLTVLIAGPADQISRNAVDDMLAAARLSLSGVTPITIDLSRVFYHPEAIVLTAQPGQALMPIREAAQKATLAIRESNGMDEMLPLPWMPHVTLCYSTDVQPAEPIIAALGKELPSCKVTIDTLSLVIQQGPERLWRWSPIGAVSLPRPSNE